MASKTIGGTFSALSWALARYCGGLRGSSAAALVRAGAPSSAAARRGLSTTPDDENKGGTPSEEGRGRNRKDAGPSATNNKKEWREWINKRVSELEEEGSLKKGDYAKAPETGRSRSRRNQHASAHQNVRRSALHLAILEELKNLPSPDPQSGFAEIGEREEDEEDLAAAEILAEIEAAAAAAEAEDDEDEDDEVEGQTGAGDPALGKGGPPSRSAGAGGDEKKPQIGRINPDRLFFPGQTYDLEDLNPFGSEDEGSGKPRSFHQTRRRRQLFNDDIEDTDDLFLRSLHFLNYDLLSRYVTEQGKILPRRKTRLKKKVQRKLVRTIKTARQMAVLPINSRVREDDGYDF